MSLNVVSFYPKHKHARSERALPSKRVIFSNAVKAAGRIVGQAVTGQKILVTKEQRLARLAVCPTCEFYRPSDKRCSHSKCACFLSQKVKFASEDCPLKKWPPIGVDDKLAQA